MAKISFRESKKTKKKNKSILTFQAEDDLKEQILDRLKEEEKTFSEWIRELIQRELGADDEPEEETETDEDSEDEPETYIKPHAKAYKPPEKDWSDWTLEEKKAWKAEKDEEKRLSQLRSDEMYRLNRLEREAKEAKEKLEKPIVKPQEGKKIGPHEAYLKIEALEREAEEAKKAKKELEKPVEVDEELADIELVNSLMNRSENL